MIDEPAIVQTARRSSFNKKSERHPWWSAMEAIVDLYESGDYAEAIEFLERRYNGN